MPINLSTLSGTVNYSAYAGSRGFTGSSGFTGSAGANGTIGVDGYTGSIGFTGSAGAGSSFDSANLVLTGSFVQVPAGNTAQRPVSPAVGMIRYNTELGGFDFYSSIGWFNIGSLEVTGVAPASFTGASGTSFTITGTGFQAGSSVKFIANDNSEYTAGSVTFINSNTLTATTPQNFTVAQEPLGVKVINPGGIFATLDDVIDCGGTPTWNTAAGSLGTFYDSGSGAPMGNIALSATDPEGSSIIYTVVSGSLPGNVSLSSGGVISGTSTVITDNTTYNFTISASDGVNSTNRAFSISIVATNYFGSGADGAGVFT